MYCNAEIIIHPQKHKVGPNAMPQRPCAKTRWLSKVQTTVGFLHL